MNDRFKFRVWNKQSNNYIKEKMFYIDKFGELFKYEKSKSTIYINAPYVMCLCGNNYIIEQCTGLKDKNDKLIYEGDILKITDQMIDYIVEVKWNEGMFCYEITPNSANLVFFDLTDNETTVEVIGNEHENADLLENEE